MLDIVDWNHISKPQNPPQRILWHLKLQGFNSLVLGPHQISKCVPHYPSSCFRRCAAQGSFLQIWWTWLIAQEFWSDLFSMLSTLFKTSLSPGPSIALLNLKPPDLRHCQFKLLLQVTIAAKQIIVKSLKIPTLCILAVNYRVIKAMIHDKIEALTSDRVAKYKALWSPWVIHFLPPNFDKSLLLP